MIERVKEHFAAQGYIDPIFDAASCKAQATVFAQRWTQWLDSLKPNSLVLVFGDYDADGVLSSALACAILSELGHRTKVYIPDRLRDGYGFSASTLARLPQDHDALLVLDSGTHAMAELPEDKPAIVVDHHEPGETKSSIRLINPKAEDVVDPVLATLCTGGLLQMLVKQCGYSDKIQEMGLCYGAITTVTDVCPLHKFHRSLVKRGLSVLNSYKCPPAMRLLSEAAELSQFTSFSLGWVIGPILNAPGRLRSAQVVTDYLLNPTEEGADELVAINKERRSITQIAVDKGLADLDETVTTHVLWDKDWHPGLAGLIAAKVSQNTGKPAIALGFNSVQGVWQGSGRAPDGVHLLNHTTTAKEHLLRFGGHAGAIGLTCADPTPLREALAHVMPPIAEVAPKWEPIPCKTWELTHGNANALEELGPFGHGWPEPIFHLTDAKLVSRRAVSKGWQGVIKTAIAQHKCYIPPHMEHIIEGDETPVTITLKWDPKWGLNLVWAE
jgi:single-stranded-DNA-specific exonuclease